jgi:hypothetical protein
MNAPFPALKLKEEISGKLKLERTLGDLQMIAERDYMETMGVESMHQRSNSHYSPSVSLVNSNATCRGSLHVDSLVRVEDSGKTSASKNMPLDSTY